MKKEQPEKHYDLLSLWSATILRQSLHGPWSPAHLYPRCRTSTAEEVRRGGGSRIPKCLFNRQQNFIINITHTSNSFSSNMASRFSGTSSFKPAIVQEVWFNARTFGFLGDVTLETGIPYLSGSVPLHPSPGWPVCTVPAGWDNASCFHL